MLTEKEQIQKIIKPFFGTKKIDKPTEYEVFRHVYQIESALANRQFEVIFDGVTKICKDTFTEQTTFEFTVIAGETTDMDVLASIDWKNSTVTVVALLEDALIPAETK